MVTTHSDSSSIGSGGERKGSQGSQGGDEHELRGEEDHVVQFETK